MSEAKKGIKRAPFSEEHRRKMNKSSSWKGKHLPEEAKRKISKAMKGRRNPMYGKPRSKATKRKISKAMKGRRNQKNL